MTTFEHDKDAILDYTIDWAAWLPIGDTIAASTWVPSDAAVVVEAAPAPSFTNTTTTAWFSCGVGIVVGNKYNVVNHITTADGREEDYTIILKIKEH